MRHVMRTTGYVVLFFTLLALAGCSDEATLTGPVLDTHAAEEEAALIEGTAKRVRGTAIIDLQGVVTKLNHRRGEAQVVFEGTTEAGEVIRGRGTMRFQGTLDASANTFTMERFRLRFRGVLGPDEQPVRGWGIADNAVTVDKILTLPEFAVAGVAMLWEANFGAGVPGNGM